jgi:hypothetical protein
MGDAPMLAIDHFWQWATYKQEIVSAVACNFTTSKTVHLLALFFWEGEGPMKWLPPIFVTN